MKKFEQVFLSLIFVFAFVFCGCENATEINAAFITEITAAASDNYGIKVTYADDKRIENKGVDIQVKCDKKIDNVVIWQEHNDKKSIAFADKDKWYSLTTLLVKADNMPNTESFEKFGEALAKTYLFNSQEKIKLTFRVVVGDPQPNVQGTGDVLTGSFQISNEFTLNVNQNK